MGDRPQGQQLTEEQSIEAKRAFLEEFAQGGIVTPALKVAGVSFPTLARWQEHDEEFSLAYNLARKAADDRIRNEIKRRGLEGYEEPVFYQGEEVSRVRRYSDTLLIFLAKSRMPEFREQTKVEHSGTISFTDLARKAIEVEVGEQQPG